MTARLYRLGRWAAARRRWVVAAWLLAAIATVGLSQLVGGEFSEEFGVPGTEAETAQQLLVARFPEQSGGSARLVLHAPSGVLTDADNVPAVRATLEAVRSLDGVAIVGDPVTGRGGALSPDGATGFADVRYSLPINELGSASVDELDAAVDVGRRLGLEVELSGELPTYYQSPHLGGAELALKVLAALVIMLVAFGSIIATGLPSGSPSSGWRSAPDRSVSSPPSSTCRPAAS
jgi:uncharacterized membrane protein YdfJ with MMPL/SSD domain